MNKPMTFDEYLAQQMENPEFRAEWESLEPMREILSAIIEGKPLTGYTLEQIADAADVSLEEARIMQKGKQVQQPRVMRTSNQARAAAQ